MEAIDYYTYDDYIQWEGKWELIDGIPVAMSPAPMIRHQAIANMIAFELTSDIQNCENCLVLNEEDWKIEDTTVLKPDVVLICDEPNDTHITKAPMIIAEIVSSSSAKRDEKYKFDIYESEKVPYYILVYPGDLKAKVYKLINDKYSKQGDFFSEIYHITDLDCKASIDFDNVFKRFRKR